MIISIHDAHMLKRYSLDESFAHLRAAGIEGVQYGMGYYLMPAEAVRGCEPAKMDASIDEILEFVRPYKEAADRNGVKISQVHAPFPMWLEGNDDVAERMFEVLKKSIVLTKYMQSEHMIVHPASPTRHGGFVTAEEEWELNHMLYVRLIPTLKENGVMALLENMFTRGVEGLRFAGACSDFNEAARWVDALNAEAGEELFGFCFDTGHCFEARQNLYRSIKIMGKRIKALHLNDNYGHMDDHRLPYCGSIQWEEVVRALKEVGYRGDLNFETGPLLGKFPPELTDECLRLTGAVGAYFKKRILED